MCHEQKQTKKSRFQKLIGFLVSILSLAKNRLFSDVSFLRVEMHDKRLFFPLEVKKELNSPLSAQKK